MQTYFLCISSIENRIIREEASVSRKKPHASWSKFEQGYDKMGTLITLVWHESFSRLEEKRSGGKI